MTAASKPVSKPGQPTSTNRFRGLEFAIQSVIPGDETTDSLIARADRFANYLQSGDDKAGQK